MRLNDAFFATWTPRAQALLRIVTGYLFLWHGSAKLLAVPHIASFDKLQLFSLIGFAGVLELVGGMLIVLGLFTRPVAFILSGEMAFAYTRRAATCTCRSSIAASSRSSGASCSCSSPRRAPGRGAWTPCGGPRFSS